MKEQQKTESINFQNEMYSWLLRRKMQNNLLQEIQEIATTNSKLKKAGYPDTLLSTAELCQILGVDAVLTSDYGLRKPMSAGAAIAVGALFGVFGSTNEVKVSLSLSDCSNKKLIWNYNHRISGGLGSSAGGAVDALMRRASKRMPY